MYEVKIDSTVRDNKSVFLYKDSRLVAKKCGDVDIISTIRDLIRENGLSTKDIQKVSSNLGPGKSFTGLKVGAVIANVINWALGRKKIGELEYPIYGREPNITPPKKFKV